MSTTLAWRGLHDARRRRRGRPAQRSLADGRRAVARIVGRDPASLDAPAVARAAIESTAENFADGVVAPLFWGLLLGLPGMLAYKALNTLDSMIGHLTPRYAISAASPPASTTPPTGCRPGSRRCCSCAPRCCLPGTAPARGLARAVAGRAHHRSPNAGWPEAAMAGAPRPPPRRPAPLRRRTGRGRLDGRRPRRGDARGHPPRAAAPAVCDAARSPAPLLARRCAPDAHRPARGERQQPVDVHRGLEMVGERIQRGLDLLLVGDARIARARRSRARNAWRNPSAANSPCT